MQRNGGKPKRGREAPMAITPRALARLLRQTSAALWEARRRRRRS